MTEVAQHAGEQEGRTPPDTPKAPLRRLWEYARPHSGALLLGGFLSFLGGAAGLAQPLVAKLVIDALAQDQTLTRPLLLLGVLLLTGALVSALGAYVLGRTGESVVLTVRRQLLTRLLRLRVGAVDRLKPGDLVSRLTSDTTLLRSVVTNSLTNVVTGSLLLIGGVVLMAVMDAILFGVTMAVLVVVGLVMGVVLPRISRATVAGQAAVGEMGALLERLFGAFRTVKASGAERHEGERLETAAHTAWRKGVQVAAWSALSGTVAGFAVNIAFLAVLGMGGVRVAAGELEVSSLIAFLLLLFYLMEPLAMLVQAATEMQSGLAAVHRIDEVATLEREEVDAAPESPTGSNGPATVAFADVTFRYAPDAPMVHHGVTFEAPSGGLTALVGPSGAGKTTVFSLLERFYDATSGAVLLDGVDVRNWPLPALRAAIGYVEQDAPVLDGTLRQNLVMAAPQATAEEIDAVVRTARLEELVARLPDGLDSAIGHRGTTISGGERQRVAIARALLRRPRLLLMDEATSQLDAANETALKQVMLDAARETSVMVVAHRLSTVTSADRIVVMEAGRVRAVGTHAELVATDELYRDLAASQLLTAS
ncbi:ABC transporter ATP-binding protein [Marinactinospora thermotolerans]|uniref:ATP-binding cassette, subfamily B n=1 Tax=Marinactinospora thermotolerans DSM 45154 TaxID=1122192 RepID=A0A1T4S6U6_9ACTN|nr:ABC transporter ATP-binding protein [Marinactinospora thermotolerans]SKA23984.1 ATP-binding cassette, subfamily B [Marinactinospora thermotolerans DSM 45154]